MRNQINNVLVFSGIQRPLYLGIAAIVFITMYLGILPSGMGAGVVPLSGMYAEALGQDSAVLISRMIPASTLGNVSAIVGAGLLAKVGDMRPGLTGNGQLMRKSDDSMKETIDNKPDYQMLGTGLILAMTFYILGVIVGKLVPAVHSYAWMIILVALSKAFGLIPEKFERAAQQRRQGRCRGHLRHR